MTAAPKRVELVFEVPWTHPSWVLEHEKTPESELRSLRTWEEGNAPPLVAIGVVSAEMPRKDYELGPRNCGAAGVGELWVFDPQRLGPRDDGGPWTLRVWSRGRRNEFRRVYAGDGPAKSDALDAWVVMTEEGSRLRVSDDEHGERVWPTEAEEARDAESERDAMRAKIAELEAMLAKSRGG